MNSNQQQIYEELERDYRILKGEQQADLLIKNIQILDVYGERIDHGSLLIDHGKIMALDPDEALISVKEVFDGDQCYAIPGLIDAHFHFESQLAHPAALADLMVPRGTTTCFVEILDLISAAEKEGFEAAQGLFQNADQLPFRVFGFAPGKKVDYDIAVKIMDLPQIIGLGEFDHFSYSQGKTDDFKLAAYAREKGFFMNGHWGLTTLSPMELNLLPVMGATNNHDVWNVEDLKKSIRYGFATQIKFGVGNVRNLLNAILNNHLPTENMMFCSDNVSVNHLKHKGHMEYIVNLAIEMGMPPMQAIRMATLNPARHFKMEDSLGSLTPGRFADLVLTRSLSNIQSEYVFKGGVQVAHHGCIEQPASLDYSLMKKKGKPGCQDLTPESLVPLCTGTIDNNMKASYYLFDVFGRGHDKFYQEIDLNKTEEGLEERYKNQDLVRIAIIERYGKGSKRHVVTGFLKGIEIQKGAIAVSFPAPKSYILVIGHDENEMLFCVQKVDQYAGACILSDNKNVRAELPLEIYGMMADLSAEELLIKTGDIDEEAKKLGFVNQGEPIVNKLLSLFISLHRFKFMK